MTKVLAGPGPVPLTFQRPTDHTGCMVGAQGSKLRIVVGVNDSGASRDAVLWAAEEARVRRLSLIITCVAGAASVISKVPSWASDEARLSAAATGASRHEPGIAVGTRLLTGDISERLIELSRSAAMLVIGVDRSQPRAAHGQVDLGVGTVGSIEARAISLARCPVVAVSRQSMVSKARHGHVVVCWTGNFDEPFVLEAAATEAEARSVPLSVVTGGPGSWPTSVERTSGTGDQVLRAFLDKVTRTHRQLRVRVHHASSVLASELQRQGDGADLLLVGYEQARDQKNTRTEGLAGLIRTAECPVMLVPVRVRVGATFDQLPR